MSFTWEVGEVVVLLADNGKGKSTLLKTLAGLQSPFEGSVDNKAKQIGWVDSGIQGGNYVTVADFLSFGISVPKKDVEQWMHFFNLNFKHSQFVESLSDGQFRKIVLIRQLLKKPDVLFLDEPTVFLDVKSKMALCACINQIKHEALVVISTHDLWFANEVATLTINLD